MGGRMDIDGERVPIQRRAMPAPVVAVRVSADGALYVVADERADDVVITAAVRRYHALHDDDSDSQT